MTKQATATAAPRLVSLIAGRWIEGAATEIADINPAHPHEVVAGGRRVGSQELDHAVSAAQAAFPSWANTPPPARGEILGRASAIVAAHAEQWGEELTREEGKTLAEGIGEVRRAADVLSFYASEGLRDIGETFASPRNGERIYVQRRPIGPIAVVTPFNFPIAIPAWKIAPALAYGNTVVWKPASAVPLLAMRLAEALVEAGLPAGVLSLLLTDGATAARLAEHPGMRAVTFTGSTAIGRRLIARCGALARPAQTEMGGKNAAAVLRDADLDLAVSEVVAGAFRSTGQKCTATSRVIVTEPVADEFLARLTARLGSWRTGDPLDPDVQMGPMVSGQACDDVVDALQRGLDDPSMRLVAGDASATSSAFLPPAVVEATGDGSLWRDELFGPVLTVRRAPDDRAALELVNDSAYGLSASVFTDDLRAVNHAMEKLEVGVLHVNSETSGSDPHVPFGGIKDSGYGPKEQGRGPLEFYTETTTVYLKASGRLGA